MNFLIGLFVAASYYVGIKSIFQNKYYPSIYSRVVWLLLSVNAFASVVALKNSFSVILLAGLGLFGSSIVLILSLRKSKKTFGPTELIASLLLIISLGIWLFTKLPLLNLSIGLLAHFIGGIPTYKKVFEDPKDEDILFWLFFAVASALAFLGADKSQLSGYLYPLYLVIFEFGMTFLCLRRYMNVKSR
ncbi:MAG: hypothetical protein Q8P13_04705 [bacterium]|nr:hypothetical protein [bacterium]